VKQPEKKQPDKKLADKKPPENLTIIARHPTEFVRELRTVLERNGVTSWTGLMPPEPGKPQYGWLAVAAADHARAQALIDAHHDTMIEDERGREATRRAADFDAAETECPACGTRFATAGAQRCPDCGLAFR
jgi:rubrerythrin